MNKVRFIRLLLILSVITLLHIIFGNTVVSANHYYGANHYSEYKASYGTSVGGSYYGGYSGSAYPYYTSYYNNGYTPVVGSYYSYKAPYYTTSYYPAIGYKMYAPVVYVASEQVPHYYKYTQPVIVSDYTSYPTYATSVVHTTSVSTNPKPDIGVPTRTTYFHNQYLTPPGFVYVVY